MWDEVAGRFQALAYPNRLQLLGELREPKVTHELDIKPGRQGGEGNPERTLTRQGIRHHLDQLAEAGLVRVEQATSQRHLANRYHTDTTGLFMLSEILREIAIFGEPVSNDQELAPRRPPWSTRARTGHTGPRLVLVHGIDEGRVFPLDPGDLGSERGWVVGRSAEVDIPLSHDPYAADQQAEIVGEPGEYEVLDLRSSSAPTYVDWEPLPLGGSARLQPGTILGIGRSLLVFREDGQGGSAAEP